MADVSMLDSFSLQNVHTTYCMYYMDVNYGIIVVDMLRKCTCHGGVMRKLFKLPFITHNYLIS